MPDRASGDFAQSLRVFRSAGSETMMKKRAFVTAHKAQYAVSTFCRVLQISRGWFYGFLTSQAARDQRQTDRKVRDMELLPKNRTFFKASNKCYGSERIHEDLVADGETVSERRVARIMKQNKVCARLNKCSKPITKDRNHKMSPSPNLLDQNSHCLIPMPFGWPISPMSTRTKAGFIWRV